MSSGRKLSISLHILNLVLLKGLSIAVFANAVYKIQSMINQTINNSYNLAQNTCDDWPCALCLTWRCPFELPIRWPLPMQPLHYPLRTISCLGFAAPVCLNWLPMSQDFLSKPSELAPRSHLRRTFVQLQFCHTILARYLTNSIYVRY